MKKFSKVVFLLVIFLLIFFYRDNIINWTMKNLIFSEEIVINENNEYALNYKYINIQKTDDFYAKSKQHLYNIVYTGLNSGNSEFSFFCEYEGCEEDVSKMSSDADENNSFLYINNFIHPYNSYKKLYISITSFKKVTISVLKAYSNDEINLVNQKLETIEKEILTDNMTTEEKIKTFHDYIVNNTHYDNEYTKSGISDPNSTSHNAVGPLFEGKALCGGYASVMSIFLNRLNIPNYRISSELHIWNLVYINNEWLHLDATWDDPVTSNNQEMLLDKFFLISTTKLKSYNTQYHNFNEFIYVEATHN